MRAERKPRRRAAAAPAPAAIAVPVQPATMWRLILWGGGGLAALALLVWAAALGLPQRLAHETAVAAAAAGFAVRQVEIEGAERQPRLDLYQALLEGGTDSMLAFDPHAARDRLVALPWIADAAVERRWPDRLRVTVTERRAVALWQQQGVIRVIDREGRVLPVEDMREFARLPLLVGPGANREATRFEALAARAPALFGRVTAATWVGGRRWDLRMDSGETVSLPEGDAALAAVERLAAIDRGTPLFGRGFIRLDLRIPDRLVVRVPTEPGRTPRPMTASPALHRGEVRI